MRQWILTGFLLGLAVVVVMGQVTVKPAGVSWPLSVPAGGAIRTGTTAGDTALLQAYNTTTAAYVSLATLTAGAAGTGPSLGIAGPALTAATTGPPALIISQTLNTTGVVDGAWRLDVTDTASNATSYFWRVNAGAAGTTLAAGLYKGAGAYQFVIGSSSTGNGLVLSAVNNNGMKLSRDADNFFVVTAGGGTDTYNDTTAGATTAIRPLFSIGAPTLTANNAQTYTDASTWYIGGAPTAGANVTITNPAAALWVDGTGDLRLGGTTTGSMRTSRTTITCTIATDTNCGGKGTATITTTTGIPAGSLVLGVDARVATIIAGSDGIASWELGTAADPDAWGAALALAATTTTGIANFTVTSPAYYTGATNITFSGTAGKVIDSGVIKITIYYVSLTPVAS